MTSATAPTASRRNSLLLDALILFILCAAGGIFSVSQGTDTFWDLKNYHLYAAFAFFKNRLFLDIAPGQSQTYFPPLFDLHYYMLIKYFNDWPRLVAFIQGIPAGIFTYLIFRISLTIATATIGFGRTRWVCAVLATTLGVTGAGFLPLVGVESGDIQVGVLSLAALTIVLECLQQPGQHVWRLGAAGALAGVALAGKLTAIMYCVPLALLVAAMFGLWNAAVFGFAMAVAFVGLWGQHGWGLWVAFGNPFFPYFNGIFKSPDWLPSALPTAKPRLPGTLQLIFYPFTWARPQTGWVAELRMQDLRLSFLYLAFALWGGIGFYLTLRTIVQNDFSEIAEKAQSVFRNNRVQIFLVLFLILSYLLWLKLFAIYRYLIVVEALTGAGLIVVMRSIFSRSSNAVVAALAGVTIIANIIVVRPNWGHVPHGNHVISIEPMPIHPGSLVVFADDSPMSYLVPFLPRDTRVISINSNFIRPDQSHGLNRLMAKVVSAHSGPFAVVSASETPETVLDKSLAAYGLSPRDCAVVRSNFAPSGHKICQAYRR